MAEERNSKLKLLYLMKLFLEKSDEEHGLTMPTIIKYLKSYGISAERKGIYRDIARLQDFGMDIVGGSKEKNYYYYLVSRQFELAELKLLVDSVQAAKFISEKQSSVLIKKIETLASEAQAKRLQRQVYVSERVKTDNKGVFYSVDAIHQAIAEHVKIRFQYFNWNVNKMMELRKDGAYYLVSPLALTIDDANYYLIAFDEVSGEVRHYRVDKMLKIEVTDLPCTKDERFARFDIASYAKKMFAMFHGDEEYVSIQCKNYLAGVMIDRFGRDVSIRPVDDETFRVQAHVAVSPQFLAWVMSLGEDAKIVGPESVLAKVREEIARFQRQYE